MLDRFLLLFSVLEQGTVGPILVIEDLIRLPPELNRYYIIVDFLDDPFLETMKVFWTIRGTILQSSQSCLFLKAYKQLPWEHHA